MFTQKRDSSSKVNSNGFALFVVGLTFAGFIGGALRFFLNSERAQQRILFEVQKKLPEWEVQANSARLHLSSGMWPGVTVELPEAKASRLGNCGEPTLEVAIKDLKIPMGLWSILQGKQRLGDISVSQIYIKELAKKTCPSSQKNSSPQSSIQEHLSTNIELERLGLRSVFDELQKRVEGLTLSEVRFESASHPDWSFMAQDLALSVGSAIHMSGGFSLWKKFSSGELRQGFRLVADLHGPLLEWNLSSSIKEGSVRWSGQVDEDRGTFLQKLTVKQGPVSDILDTLLKVGVLKSSFETKRLWLNCQVTQSGSFKGKLQVEELPLRVDHCDIDGELGKISFEPQVFYLKEPFLRNGPLSLKLGSVSVETLVDFFGGSKMPVIFSQLGFWSGKVETANLKDLSFQGQLEGLRVNVSNKSLRGIEIINRIQMTGEVSQDHVQMKLSEIEIFGGSRDGKVQVSYDFKKRGGEFDLEFEHLEPSEPIQSLLIQGKSSPIQLSLNGKLGGGELQALKGSFSSAGAQGSGWVLSQVRGRIDQKGEESFRVSFQAKELNWDSKFKYHGLIDQIFSRYALSMDKKQISQMNSRLDVFPEGGKIHRAQALLGGSKEPLRFTGAWERGQNLKGKVRFEKREWLNVELSHLEGQVLN